MTLALIWHLSLASRAVAPTQKSKASPTTQTYSIFSYQIRHLSLLLLLLEFQSKALQESTFTITPLSMMMSEGSTCRRGENWAPQVPATQWSGQSYWNLNGYPQKIVVSIGKGFIRWVEAKEMCLGWCQSLQIMTCEKISFLFLRALMGAKMSLLPGTAREPFSQKSF